MQNKNWKKRKEKKRYIGHNVKNYWNEIDTEKSNLILFTKCFFPFSFNGCKVMHSPKKISPLFFSRHLKAERRTALLKIEENKKFSSKICWISISLKRVLKWLHTPLPYIPFPRTKRGVKSIWSPLSLAESEGEG